MQNGNLRRTLSDLTGTTGKRIALLRRGLDITQEELTLRLGEAGVDIGRSYISVIERSTKVPSGEVLAGLARVLGTTTDYLLLLTDDPGPGQPSVPKEPPLPPSVQGLVDRLMRWPAESRVEIADAMGRMLDAASQLGQGDGTAR